MSIIDSYNDRPERPTPDLASISVTDVNDKTSLAQDLINFYLHEGL